MRAEFQRIAELVETAALAVVKQINAGKFRPFASEVNFGHDNDAYPPLRIQAENGVTYSITALPTALTNTFHRQMKSLFA